MELSSDWKLILTDSNPRIVHARGCEYIKDWIVDGSLEIPKLRPDKHNVCHTCAYLAFTTLGAKDYVENVTTYKRIFKDVPIFILKELFTKKRAKCFIRGSRVYFEMKQDLFYVDFTYDDVHLYHANYCVRKRENGQFCEKGGYHEHKINGHEMKNALYYLMYYDFEKAKSGHEKKRKKRVRMTLSEYDPELYGFTDA